MDGWCIVRTIFIENIYLIIGYINGFQIWDITDINSINEICSQRLESLCILKFLYFPHSNNNLSLHNIWKTTTNLPILLTVSSIETRNTSKKAIGFYSLKNNSYIHIF